MIRLPVLLLLLLTAAGAATAGEAFDAVLDAAGWGEARRATLGDELSEADLAELLQLADRLDRFKDRLRTDAAPAASPLAAPPLTPTAFSLTVTGVQLLAASDDTPAHARVAGEAAGAPITLLANQVPQAWRSGAALPQPAHAVGLIAGAGRVVVVAWRWTPDQAAYPEVNFGESVLGSLGVDVGSLDAMIDGGRLRAVESAPFYEVLSAMREIGPNQLVRFGRGNLPAYAAQWEVDPQADGRARALAREARRAASEGRYPIAPLFNDAVRQRGELYVLDGIARRAVAIETAAAAGERSVSADYGVDRYYEIELFTEDSRNLPLVFCTLEVPEGFPLGDRIEAPVRVAGFSLKRWAYRTRQRRADGSDKPQLAPLLIGRAPVLLAPPATRGPAWGVILGGGFAAALALVCWAVWRSARNDAAFEQATRRRLAEVDSAALDQLAEDGGLSAGGRAGQNEGS